MEMGLAKASLSLSSGHPELWEYLLVAYPDAEVARKIKDVQRCLGEQYKMMPGMNQRPFIPIANFFAKEQMEGTLIKWIQRVCSEQKSFTVTLNNYSGFPPDTIYVRIQDHQPFRQIATGLKVIDEYIRGNGCPPPTIVHRPYLAIAGGLDDNLYNRAMPDFSRQCFHEHFAVTELVFFKRCNEYDDIRQVNVFRLYPPDTNMYNEVA